MADGNVKKDMLNKNSLCGVYRMIFERSRTAVFITDRFFCISEANAAAEKLSGYGPGEISSMKLSEMIIAEGPSSQIFKGDNAFTDEGSSFAARLIKKDKTAVAAEISVKKISGGIFIVSADISKINKTDDSPDKINIIEYTIHATLDALPLWIAYGDTLGNYQFANKYYSATFKLPIENIIGHNFKEIFPPDLYKKHKLLYDECIKTCCSVTFEDKVTLENGLTAYAYGLYTPLFAEDKTVYGVSVASFDITAKKELELQIQKAFDETKESEEKYRTLVENSICGIGIKEGDKIIYANKTLMKMFGYDDFKEFSSKKTTDYQTPESQKKVKIWMDKKSIGEADDDQIEVDIIHKSGKLITVVLNSADIKIDGKTYTQSAFIDITERKKLKEALKEWTLRYEYIVEASGQLAYDYNLTNGEISWETKPEKLLGYKTKELKSTIKTWSELLHPQDREKSVKKLNEAEGVMLDDEYRLRHKDGHYVWVRDRGIFLRDESGRAIRQIGMLQDISGLKNAEIELISAMQQAESASKAKSVFLANISHEIRTPMNGIMGFTNLLGSSGLNERQKEFNSIIKESCAHLMKLVDDLLDFSNIETKKLKLENAPFNIHYALISSIEIVSEYYKAKNLELEKFVDERINYLVIGDQLRFKQIVINLLTNAIKYTSKGKIGIKILQSSLNEGVSNITIEVSDTGIGIPREKIGEIFEMFHQLGDSNTSRHGGSGIGLSIVKGLIEIMGGNIRVESEPEKGSKFIVELPFNIVRNKG
ncbi:MAG: Signal transduction histidine-protein kinase BarA [bacterium ADurb.Bin243]|nr:MAG: Signal transduction histidine-protein kinase BarA [bacterium ADurb.Bin243]